MASPRDYSSSRRELLLLFDKRPQTAAEASKALGRPTGSFYGVLRRMHAEGLVIADPDPPTRGTLYRLSPTGRDLLQELVERSAQPGMVNRGQQLLVVDPPADPRPAMKVLDDPQLAAQIAWAAETAGGWVIALAPDTASSYPGQRLRAALIQAGAPTRELYVTGLLTGREFRDRAGWMIEDLEGHRP